MWKATLQAYGPADDATGVANEKIGHVHNKMELIPLEFTSNANARDEGSKSIVSYDRNCSDELAKKMALPEVANTHNPVNVHKSIHEPEHEDSKYRNEARNSFNESRSTSAPSQHYVQEKHDRMISAGRNDVESSENEVERTFVQQVEISSFNVSSVVDSASLSIVDNRLLFENNSEISRNSQPLKNDTVEPTTVESNILDSTSTNSIPSRLYNRVGSFQSSDADDEMDELNVVAGSDYEWTEDERVERIPLAATATSDIGMTSYSGGYSEDINSLRSNNAITNLLQTTLKTDEESSSTTSAGVAVYKVVATRKGKNQREGLSSNFEGVGEESKMKTNQSNDSWKPTNGNTNLAETRIEGCAQSSEKVATDEKKEVKINVAITQCSGSEQNKPESGVVVESSLALVSKLLLQKDADTKLHASEIAKRSVIESTVAKDTTDGNLLEVHVDSSQARAEHYSVYSTCVETTNEVCSHKIPISSLALSEEKQQESDKSFKEKSLRSNPLSSIVLRPEIPPGALTVFNNSKKFVFLSDENAIPKQLNKLQEQTLRQQRQFQERIHDLECKIASLTARLATESMDTDIDLKSIKDDSVLKPLEQSYQRMSLYCARTCLGSTRWISLEKRVSLLDSQMTHSVFVGYPDAKRKHIDALRNVIDNEVKIEMKVDSVQADKREGAIVRKFEEVVGSFARRYQEERTTRLATMQTILDDLKSRHCDDGLNRNASIHLSGHEEMLSTIRTLRERLAAERILRQENDSKILEEIVERHRMMQTSILEAFGDPNF